MSACVCDLATPMHWTVMGAIFALALVAMWVGYLVGHSVGVWRALNRGTP